MKIGFFRLQIKPSDFWEMRPKDLFLMIEAYNEVNIEKEELQIRLTREVIATIMNNGFREYDSTIKGAEIWPLESDPIIDTKIEYTQEELQGIEDLLNRSIAQHENGNQ